ncbi:hypothetical protein B0T17DRAFT_648638 [Bombardia bombarda]|uniref:Uncharacterized protein n=1 Tax=Bombardia bombarda TaxID=252184 RepID=A0AA39U4V5_9PEZI|nr:hypothetical protein B0T17DRAFT_648638 [Bombardia bombarda]
MNHQPPDLENVHPTVWKCVEMGCEKWNDLPATCIQRADPHLGYCLFDKGFIDRTPPDSCGHPIRSTSSLASSVLGAKHTDIRLASGLNQNCARLVPALRVPCEDHAATEHCHDCVVANAFLEPLTRFDKTFLEMLKQQPSDVQLVKKLPVGALRDHMEAYNRKVRPYATTTNEAVALPLRIFGKYFMELHVDRKWLEVRVNADGTPLINSETRHEAGKIKEQCDLLNSLRKELRFEEMVDYAHLLTADKLEEEWGVILPERVLEDCIAFVISKGG